MSAGTGRQPTTALAVKHGLQTMLDTLIATERTTVAYGPPDEGYQSELAVLGNITWETVDWAQLGKAHHRDERYSLELIVAVKADGGTQREATERAGAIYQVIDEALVSTPDLSGVLWPGAQIFWVLPRPRILAEGFLGQARTANLVADLNVYARI